MRAGDPARRDPHDRVLTTAERSARDRLLPALAAWTAYLDAVAARRTYDAAAQAGAPIVARHRPSPALYGPIVVCPEWAWQWARETGRAARGGTGAPLTFGLMVAALDYMHADRAVTFRPAGEPSGCRRRDGFFHAHPELHARLRGANYTPVLRARLGRARQPERLPGVRAPRPVRAADEPDYTLTLVRDWVRTNEPTALLDVAMDTGRPLAVRGPGRPRVDTSAPAVARGYVLGQANALTLHAQEHGDRLGIRVPLAAEVTAALAAHAQDGSAVEPVRRFSTVDAPNQRGVRGWWRFALAPLGLPEVEPADLAGEVEFHRRRRSDDEVAAPADGVVEAADGVLPPGADPAWLDDPEYRDLIGMGEEDYERWRATQ